MSKNKKIILLGAGNVATQLGFALKKSGHQIIQVYSRTSKSANALAKQLNASSTINIKELSDGGDIYIIAFKDDAIKDIVKEIRLKNKLIVHTSGTVDVNILKGCSKNYGVFYPLQTFSKNSTLNFKSIPLCIEASNRKSEKLLTELGKSISDKIHRVDSEKRRIIHLAAVFANNFTNHMYAIAENILEKNNISFNILVPLIEETAEKIKTNSASKIQTGPAKRGDKKTMNEHIKMLSKEKTHQALYKLISKSISENNA